MREQIDEVLQFWFGDLTAGFASPEREQLWWRSNEETDRLIERLFGAQVREALNGGFGEWMENPRGILARILLLDQFTRQIYRGTAEAFSGDKLALDCCLEGLSKGYDKTLELTERVFFYMPLEHAESIEAQNQSVTQFESLLVEVPKDRKLSAQRWLDFACQHREQIEQFGRFPHRNEVLKRTSSEHELLFLQQFGDRWGQ